MKLLNLTREEIIAEDAELIRNPFKWPGYPFLPVKRRNWDRTVHPSISGVIHCGNRLKVVDVGIFDLPKTKSEFDALKFDVYETMEELLKVWEVD